MTAKAVKVTDKDRSEYTGDSLRMHLCDCNIVARRNRDRLYLTVGCSGERPLKWWKENGYDWLLSEITDLKRHITTDEIITFLVGDEKEQVKALSELRAAKLKDSRVNNAVKSAVVHHEMFLRGLEFIENHFAPSIRYYRARQKERKRKKEAAAATT